MNKNLWIITALITVLIIGGFYFSNQELTSQSKEMPIMEEKALNKMESDPVKSNNQSSGVYLEYTPDTFQSLTSNKKVLFFYASWCPTCKSADVSFESNKSRLPEDLALVRINYNDPSTDESEKALAAKYGITYQHTFVLIDRDGNAIAKWNGGETEELLRKIN